MRIESALSYNIKPFQYPRESKRAAQNLAREFKASINRPNLLLFFNRFVNWMFPLSGAQAKRLDPGKNLVFMNQLSSIEDKRSA